MAEQAAADARTCKDRVRDAREVAGWSATTGRWHNARQEGGRQTATCGRCRAVVNSTGTTIAGTITGGMTQTR